MKRKRLSCVPVQFWRAGAAGAFGAKSSASDAAADRPPTDQLRTISSASAAAHGKAFNTVSSQDLITLSVSVATQSAMLSSPCPKHSCEGTWC